LLNIKKCDLNLSKLTKNIVKRGTNRTCIDIAQSAP